MPPKRRRRFQGLYYHSSPPKVFNLNDMAQHSNRKRRDDDLSIKLSTIRIWMHEKDITNLKRILWAGQGNRLCQQASTNARMKRFLSAVPYVMNAIKEVHQSVIDNNLETLQAKLEPPVPQALVTCRDANGLNVLHKAAGLGHTKILEYLIGIWPEGAHETDITGKTALHWAASAKNNMRCYTLLTQAGCDEEAVDYKMKSPTYYRHKPHEIERAFLVYVPDAPRVSPEVSTDWEALSDELPEVKKAEAKVSPTNGATDDNIETTSEVELPDEGTSAQEELEKAKESQPEEATDGASSTADNVEENGTADTAESADNKDENANEHEKETKQENENDTEAEANKIENELVEDVENKEAETAVEPASDENEEVPQDGAEENTNTVVLSESAAAEGIENANTEESVPAKDAGETVSADNEGQAGEQIVENQAADEKSDAQETEEEAGNKDVKTVNEEEAGNKDVKTEIENSAVAKEGETLSAEQDENVEAKEDIADKQAEENTETMPPTAQSDNKSLAETDISGAKETDAADDKKETANGEGSAAAERVKSVKQTAEQVVEAAKADDADKQTEDDQTENPQTAAEPEIAKQTQTKKTGTATGKKDISTATAKSAEKKTKSAKQKSLKNDDKTSADDSITKDKETGENLNVHGMTKKTDAGKKHANIPNGKVVRAASAADKEDDDEDEVQFGTL